MKRLFLIVAMLCVAGAALAADEPKKSAAEAPKKAAATEKDSAIQQIEQFIAGAKIDKTKPNWKTTLPKPPVATFEKAHKYLAHMTTNKGPVVIELMPKVAPMHVTSFIYLAKLGFYDGLKFHRVIKNFMAQGGDPLGTGGGSPGYKMDGEFSPAVKHDQPGRLSTANAGPGTDGSQFFLTFVPYPSLDMKYTIYGQVVEGMDTLKKLEAGGASGDGPPVEPENIQKVTIEVK